MRTSAHMGLKVWNLLEDPYDHEQLADNWAKVDSHDHSPGRGVLIPTEGIANEAITSSLLSSSLNLARYEQGTLSERPVTGTKGLIWYATDTEEYSVYTGSAWQKIGVGAWTAFTFVSGKVAEFLTLRARTEGSAATCRIRGALTAETGLDLGESLLVLPPTMHPPYEQVVTASYEHSLSGGSISLYITTAGAIGLWDGTLSSGTKIFLDGITFPLI